MAFLFKEITNWDFAHNINHVYIFEDKPGKRSGKAIGYIKKGTEVPFWFRKPLDIDFKNRNFIRVGNN